MPLPPPVERQHLHTRTFQFSGYRRDDGLWDIDGHMTDIKTYGFKNEFRGEIGPEEPLHDMWIRLTLDDDFLVHDIEAATEAAPYQVCPQITPNFKKVVGLRVGRGWRQKIRERVGGVEGCTHLFELLGAMATVAFQTIYPVRAKTATARASTQKPVLIDSCHAFRADGEVVKKTWPDFYTGS